MLCKYIITVLRITQEHKYTLWVGYKSCFNVITAVTMAGLNLSQVIGVYKPGCVSGLCYT
jgi:hypothetical protein